jgi:ribosome biogenesis GTPase / thiamine phosphate phosphatase
MHGRSEPIRETTPGSSSHTAVIRASYGTRGIAELGDGAHCECRYQRSVGRPLCGDVVELQTQEDSSLVVSAILPRRNIFVRADRQQRQQAVASNLDQVVIVISPQPSPSKDLVERYLVAVHSLYIKPVLLVNKAELLSAGDRSSLAPFSRISVYRELGYTVLEASCAGPPGVDRLREQLHGTTSILVGQSGVGKSSLANSLIPDLELQTGALSRTTGKGTHTTTTTIMYSLPCGGRLIDSPGVWEYGLWTLTTDELAAGFPEIAPLHQTCRFGDCRHRGEPGCAVQAAVSAGQIRPWRYESYRRLLDQST